MHGGWLPQLALWVLRQTKSAQLSLGAGRCPWWWCYAADVSDLERQDPRPVVLIRYMYRRKIAKTSLDIKPRTHFSISADHLDVVSLHSLHLKCYSGPFDPRQQDNQTLPSKVEQQRRRGQWSLPLSRAAPFQEPHNLYPPMLSCRLREQPGF